MRKLLLVRPDGIGDFIIFSAVLEEYQKVFSDYQIDLLCDRKVKELAESIPFINKVICIDAQKVFRKRYFIDRAFIVLQILKLKYDKIIYPVYSRTKSGDFLVHMVKAKEKVGFDGNDSNDPKNERFARNKYFTDVITSDKREKPEIERNAEFINKLGGNISLDSLKPKILFSTSNSNINHNLQSSQYIAIFPGAGFSVRYWENNKWVELIKKVIHHYPQYKIVVLGYGNDCNVAKKVLSLLRYEQRNIINLCGKTSLRRLAQIVKNAKIVIGTESSAVHIAAAVGTPNICLMGGGHFGRFYPYGDLSKNRIIYKKMDCFGCNWRCKYNVARCVREIQVEDVWKKIASFL